MSTDKGTIEAYNDHAEQWAKVMREGENVAHEYLEKPAMYKRIPDLTGKTVLSIGCGSGEECNYLKSLGASKVVGIDVSEGLIEQARQSYPDIEFHVMDMENINLNETFDFVYSSLVMHYVESWEKTLDTLSQIMTEDATLLLSTQHPVKWGAKRSPTENER
ncbi:MAG: trans-aconitate 2-methyltransferase, partial [Candidatus Paceibacteria bacterium]